MIRKQTIWIKYLFMRNNKPVVYFFACSIVAKLATLLYIMVDIIKSNMNSKNNNSYYKPIVSRFIFDGNYL